LKNVCVETYANAYKINKANLETFGVDFKFSLRF